MMASVDLLCGGVSGAFLSYSLKYRLTRNPLCALLRIKVGLGTGVSGTGSSKNIYCPLHSSVAVALHKSQLGWKQAGHLILLKVDYCCGWGHPSLACPCFLLLQPRLEEVISLKR